MDDYTRLDRNQILLPVTKLNIKLNMYKSLRIGSPTDVIYRLLFQSF
jgi:hypothetical protein